MYKNMGKKFSYNVYIIMEDIYTLEKGSILIYLYRPKFYICRYMYMNRDNKYIAEQKFSSLKNGAACIFIARSSFASKFMFFFSFLFLCQRPTNHSHLKFLFFSHRIFKKGDNRLLLIHM